MDESIKRSSEQSKVFPANRLDIRTYSPLTLAYIGDAGL